MRRLASFLGFIALILLALCLLWLVYIHHSLADPYDREDAISVELDVPPVSFVKISTTVS